MKPKLNKWISESADPALKRSMDRVLSACKISDNERLCMRFSSQLNEYFEDDTDDEALKCSDKLLDEAADCYRDPNCLKNKSNQLKSTFSTCLKGKRRKCRQYFYNLVQCSQSNIFCIFAKDYIKVFFDSKF